MCPWHRQGVEELLLFACSLENVCKGPSSSLLSLPLPMQKMQYCRVVSWDFVLEGILWQTLCYHLVLIFEGLFGGYWFLRGYLGVSVVCGPYFAGISPYFLRLLKLLGLLEIVNDWCFCQQSVEFTGGSKVLARIQHPLCFYIVTAMALNGEDVKCCHPSSGKQVLIHQHRLQHSS